MSETPPPKLCWECSSENLTYEPKTFTYWCADCGEANFYTRYNELYRDHCLHCKQLMTPTAEGVLVHEDFDDGVPLTCPLAQAEQKAKDVKERRTAMYAISGGKT